MKKYDDNKYMKKYDDKKYMYVYVYIYIYIYIFSAKTRAAPGTINSRRPAR